MNELKRAVIRAASEFDKFVGFAMAVAILKAESVHSRTASEDFLLQLMLIRRYAIGVLNGACQVEAERLIHMPAMPDVGLLDFEQTGKPVEEPGPIPDTLEFPSASSVPGLGSWQELGDLVKQP